ncbi:MAG: hypothetical protein JSW58_08605 [Candidatus Latescibacterota bacterium]|nr:MAG: hypothetical protein JSW58_08605 [Candidatus Latescibacterota bacterium]
MKVCDLARHIGKGKYVDRHLPYPWPNTGPDYECWLWKRKLGDPGEAKE